MKKLSTKNRGVRALIVTGIAGASIVAGGLTGSIAESRPLQSNYCYDYPVDLVNRVAECTQDTRPEIVTTTEAPGETTTTEAPGETTTTEAPAETTTTVAGTPTTAAPGSTSTTTAPRGVAGAGAARPIAAQASYAG